MKEFKYYISFIAILLVLLTVGNTGYAQSPWDRTDVAPDHDWKITFNSKIDFNSINQENIFVMQDSQNVQPIQIIPNADQKSITIEAPPNGYEKGKSYTLYILDSVKSANGTPLKKQITMQFTIKKDIVVENNYEHEVLRLVNVEREKNGLAPLNLYEELSDVAREKSNDMKINNYFDHTSPTYGSPFDMMAQFGITYRAAGENIAAGYPTPQEVVTGWMNSPGHRANILNPGFTHIGIGYVNGGSYGTYWTQMFVGL